MCGKFMDIISRKFCCVYVEEEESKKEEECYSKENTLEDVWYSTESLCSELCNNFLPESTKQTKEKLKIHTQTKEIIEELQSHTAIGQDNTIDSSDKEEDEDNTIYYDAEKNNGYETFIKKLNSELFLNIYRL